MKLVGILICFVIVLLHNVVSQKFNPGNTFSNCVRNNPGPRNCRGFTKNSGFRTLDGTCNNLKRRTHGAINTPLLRLLNPDYTDKKDTPRGFPGTKPIVPPANKVSRGVVQVERNNKGNARHLSVLFMAVGQFLDHDIGLAPFAECEQRSCGSINAFKYPCFPILFTKGGSQCTPFGRAKPVCQNGRKTARNQFNSLTSFIDGSQIYGTTFRLHQQLRKQDGSGKLKVDRANLLPLKDDQGGCRTRGGCSLVGDIRGDENIALYSMHTVWVREHNRISIELKKLNSRWSGEKIFQTARKIIGAQFQHIIYTEFLPKIVKLPKYKGYKKSKNPSIVNVFSAAAFRFGHSLIPNSFTQLNKGFNKAKKSISLQDAFFNRGFISANGIESTMFGLIGNQSNPVDTGFALGVARKLFVPPGDRGHMDLVALNIQRGRDHGIPTYGKWRKKCNLKPVKTYGDLREFIPRSAVNSFKKLYTNPNDIDLFAAGIAEFHVRGLQVGPTFACIFKNQFRRLRDGDRFFYQSKGVFTKKQFNEIKKVTMSRILCNNLRGIVSIQRNAFLAGSSGIRRINCNRIQKVNLRAWKV